MRSKVERLSRKGQYLGLISMGYVIWFTGISGSGKTTLARRLVEELKKKHGRVELIDGDVVREFFEHDLGYTRQERIANVKRIAFAAMLLAKNGIHVIVANIAPYVEVRDFIRKHLEEYIQIYLNVPLKIAMERDVQGHYTRYRQESEKNIVGVDDPYEAPRNPDLVIDTSNQTEEESVHMILEHLKTHHNII